MFQRQTIILLRLVAAASVLIPLGIFVSYAWTAHEDAKRNAFGEVGHKAEILAVSVQRTLNANLLMMKSVQVMLNQLSTDGSLGEQRLHGILKSLLADNLEVAGVWVFDADGRIVGNSATYPVPPDITAKDRSYFVAHRERGLSLFVSEPLRGRVVDQAFVSISVPWTDGGAFKGVIQNSMYLSGLEGILDQFRPAAPDATMSLIREDGTLLARYPRAPAGSRAGGGSVFDGAIAKNPVSGQFRTTSLIDGMDRLTAYRRVGEFPVYVAASVTYPSVRAAWLDEITEHLFFGIPASLAMLALTMLALRRTQRLHREFELRSQAEAALRQAQKMEALGQFTGRVAHEVNNLLMVIVGSIELLADRQGRDHEQTVMAVLSAAARGEKLTRQLLMSSKSQVLEPQVIDLTTALPAWRDLIACSLREDIVIRMHVALDVKRVKLDRAELELAITNIGVNARDAMPKGGEFRISARNAHFPIASTSPIGLVGDYVLVTFRDTGVGVAPEHIGRVFEPFFTTKDAAHGTGLGLSQVYQLARHAGGIATVESVPGEGTSISLYLKATDEFAVTDAGAALAAVPQLGVRVLLVEDNDSVSDVTAAMLVRLDCTVVRASNGKEALALLETGRREIDIVLSDIVMPGGMSGVDLARAVQARFPGLPVLLATGFSTVVEAGTRDGFEIIRKPFDLRRLADALAQQLGHERCGAPVR